VKHLSTGSVSFRRFTDGHADFPLSGRTEVSSSPGEVTVNAVMTPTRGATSRRHGHHTTLIPISRSLQQVMVEGFSPAELHALAAAIEARDHHVPDWLAVELANEVADIVSQPPMETECGLIPNRPTVGWWQRRARRIADSRASA
jgi:hypothetical protein